MSRIGIAWTSDELGAWVHEARERSLALLGDLDDAQLLGPRLEIVNPLLWEIGHVAWFQERWVLREGLGGAPLREEGDGLWDSAGVAHDTRWDLALPSRDETWAYARDVCERVLDRLATSEIAPELRYFVLLSVFHEDMHTEAFTYTRQTLAYAAPAGPGGDDQRRSRAGASRPSAVSEAAGDVEVAGGELELGAARDEPFVFDNEQWAHPVAVRPFAMARTPVTQGGLLAFVEDGGYGRRALWSDTGWRWRERAGADRPLYWRREGHGWWRRRFDTWVELEPELPALHVNAHEAEAYCRWAGRRLPTELEWEWAAGGPEKRRFPWGDDPPGPKRARLDGEGGGPVPVQVLQSGESPLGLRHLIGNAWEWTASPFAPYPGFEPGPYREYSAPWFHTHRVLRGGCWCTRGRLLRNTWRNFYEPHRRDVWAGFRTCALETG